MIKQNIAQKKFWKNKNVFLTGHTSFKGSWLKLWLEFLGANVVGYSLNLPSQPKSLYKILFNEKFTKQSVLNISNLTSDQISKASCSTHPFLGKNCLNSF